MSDPVTVSTLGKLTANIRTIFGKLDPLAKKAEGHDEDIKKLKARAELAQKELDDLKKITNHQGQELEQHKKHITRLTGTLENLEAEVEEMTAENRQLGSAVRGEQIKRGKANARASRAEDALSRIKRK